MRKPLAFRVATSTFALIGLLLAGCAQPDQTVSSESSEAAALQVESGALDFGEVWITDSFPFTFEVGNGTDEPVEVAEIRTSCNCTEVVPSHFALSGNDRQAIALKIDFTNYGNRIDSLTVPFQTVLRPVMKDHPRSEWRINGRVRLPFAVPSGRIDLGEITGESGRFELQRHPLVSEINVAATGAVSEVRLVRRGDAGNPDQYEVELSHEIPYGPFQSRLRFSATALDGTVIRPIEVVASGLLGGDLSWSPHQLVLTSGRSDARGEAIVIRSRSNIAFAVERISSESEFVEAEVVSVEPGESKVSVQVRLADNLTHDVNVDTKILIAVKESADGVEHAIAVPVMAYSRPAQEDSSAAKN